jgi:hypothetical protein
LSTPHAVALWSVLSPITIVVGALVLIGLERARPYNPQRFLRKGFWTDLLGYTFAQSYVLGLVIARLSAWACTRPITRPRTSTGSPVRAPTRWRS